jgi:hypothetical protein
MSVYKPFKPQDYAVVPFNAHKLYDFTSASAAANKVVFQTTFFDADSPVDGYVSNNIRYSQIEHMFYRNYFTDIDDKFGDINYLKHKRALYERANTLSIPSGLYGHKVNPGSFFLSSSYNKVVDDTYGNLIVEGTNVDDYVTDPRKVLLDIGPVKGFKRYDLDIYGEFVNDIYYKRGQKRVNSLYTPELFPDNNFDIIGVIPTTGPLSQNYTHTDNNAYIYNNSLVINQFHPEGYNALNFTHQTEENKTYRIEIKSIRSRYNGEIEIVQGSSNTSLLPVTIIPTTENGTQKTHTFYYTSKNNEDIKIYLRVHEIEANLDNSTYDKMVEYNFISVKELGQEGYSTPSNKYEYDDSYFLNKIYYNKVSFNPFFLDNHPNLSHIFNDNDSIPNIDFNGNSSEIKIHHDPKFNFNYNDDFSIEFWIKPTPNSQSTIEYIIGKSTTKTVIPSPAEGTAGIKSLSQTGSSQLKDIASEPQFPFEIYLDHADSEHTNTSTSTLIFKRSNGETETILKGYVKNHHYQHIVCNYSNSEMTIWNNGDRWQGISDVDGSYQNNANIYIGNKGGHSNYFRGSLGQIKIYNQALTPTQITNNVNSINGSPYVGNIFYSNGIATITHPKYQHILALTDFGIGEMTVDDNNDDIAIFTVGDPQELSPIHQLKFEGSHLIYENEYQCNLDEHEYNSTLNPSARKHKSIQTEELADFATGSLFKPYITTIGLYNEKNELLVVGKLGQPIRTSNETDTTLIVRWDT